MSGAVKFANDSEAVVVASWFKHHDRLIQSASVVHEEFFTDERLRIVWRAIQSLRDARERPDVVIVGSWLNGKRLLEAIGGTNFIGDIVADFGATSTTYDYHVARIAEAYSKRRLADAMRSALALIESDPEATAEEVTESVVSSVIAIQKSQDSGNRGRTFHEIAASVTEELAIAHDPERRHELEKRFIPTGIGALDAIIEGLEGGRTYCVGARPSVGKSAILLTVAILMARRGVRCGISSLEMSDEQVFKRAVMADTGMAWKQLIRTPNMLGPALDAIAKNAELPIIVDDKPSATMARISGWARAEKARNGLGALLIDYLQLVKGIEKKGGNREQEIASISRGLKELARELGIPVIFAAQLKRPDGATTTKPNKASLRESGAIEQDADVIVLLHTEADPADGDDEVDLDLIVDKNRDGKTGTAEMVFDKRRMRFYPRGPA